MARSSSIVTSVLLILFCVSEAVSDNQKYRGYHVLQATPDTDDQAEQLARYLNENDVDVWNFPRGAGSSVTFTVSRDNVNAVRAWFHNVGISLQDKANDLQRLIDHEAEEEQAAKDVASRLAGIRTANASFNFNIYHDHNEINDFIWQTAASCDICHAFTIGQSYEGREMVVLKIGTHESGKPGVWIDAGIHAREWIAPATALNIINQLVDGHSRGDPVAEEMLDTYVWYILPSGNPDGYMFSRAEDRMWRKTRSPNEGSRCRGTDPNRNWSFHWDEAGTSRDPCSNVYSGTRPFSEIETRHVSTFVLKKRRLFRVFLSLHSYGQWWLSAWAYRSELPQDHEELMRVGQAAVDAIRGVNGTQFTLGATANILYAAAGSSADWAKGTAGIKYAYVPELRDDGYYGFLLPPRFIQPVGEEMWQGIVALARAAAE